MELRKASMSDAKMLFEWRNDYTTRLNSTNTEEVLWDSHLKWLENSLNDMNRKIFIAEVDHVAVGTIRVDYLNDHTELSWTIAPDSRGMGYGSAMLRQLAGSLGNRDLWALIKMDNRPSQRMAEAAGFHFDTMYQGMGVWRRKPRTPLS